MNKHLFIIGRTLAILLGLLMLTTAGHLWVRFIELDPFIVTCLGDDAIAHLGGCLSLGLCGGFIMLISLDDYDREYESCQIPDNLDEDGNCELAGNDEGIQGCWAAYFIKKAKAEIDKERDKDV